MNFLCASGFRLFSAGARDMAPGPAVLVAEPPASRLPPEIEVSHGRPKPPFPKALALCPFNNALGRRPKRKSSASSSQQVRITERAGWI